MSYKWKPALSESIRQWEARPRFGELKPAILARIPDDLLEQAVIDFVLNHRAWPEDRLVALLGALPSGFSTVYTTWWLDSEIANGGFHQYFWNTAGLYVDLVERALDRLEADEHQRTFQQAVRVARLQAKPEVSHLPPQIQLETFSESALEGAFDDLDSRWSELGQLSSVRVRFMRANPDLFVARLPGLARMRLTLSALWSGRRSKR
jgi:hypothetical protein